jgi:apolipoprotein N-acyltransferase
VNGRNADKSLGEIVQEVSEKASLLVRQEIDLAKAEVGEKVSSLGKGAGIAAAAGVFGVFAIFVFLFFLAFIINDLLGDFGENVWPGFLIVFILLVILTAIAGFVAYRFFKKGAPPTPDMAIEEAKLTKAQFEHQGIERDQLGRSAGAYEQIEKGS